MLSERSRRALVGDPDEQARLDRAFGAFRN